MIGILRNPCAGSCFVPWQSWEGVLHDRKGRPLDIALVSHSVSLLTQSSLCSSCVSGLLGPLLPQAKPKLVSHAWVGQPVATHTRANRSVSSEIYLQTLGS